MSKLIDVAVKCSTCGYKFEAQLYRSLWIEHEKYRDLVLDDHANLITCPSCKTSHRANFSLLCTNVKKQFAVWYEPTHDAQIDKDIALYSAQFGKNSFYATAPRIKNWNAFKEKLTELEKNIKLASQQNIYSKPNQSSTSNNSGSNKAYPKWLSHLQKVKPRFLYSTVPATVLTIFALNEIERHFAEWFFSCMALTAITFIFLTIIHIIFNEYKPWHLRSKLFRITCFLSTTWIIATFIFVGLFSPYNGRMNDEDYLHMFAVAFIIPIFFSSAIYIYKRFIDFGKTP